MPYVLKDEMPLLKYARLGHVFKRKKKGEDVLMTDNERTKGQMMGKEKYNLSLSGRP